MSERNSKAENTVIHTGNFVIFFSLFVFSGGLFSEDETGEIRLASISICYGHLQVISSLCITSNKTETETK